MNDETVCTLNDILANAPLTLACKMADETPMWTDTFSALGTVGATLIAAGLGFQTIRFTLQDRQARRAQEIARGEQEKRSQAERVACWLKVDVNGHLTHSIVAVNASDQPIWDVKMVNPSLGMVGFSKFPVLAPGETRPTAIQPRTGNLATLEEPVDIHFRDNAGRKWYRPAHSPGALILEKDLEDE